MDNYNCPISTLRSQSNSKNFVTHKNDPKLCDLIVCWEHDWKDCPIEVISLKDIIEHLS
jgi:hypothetical protein